MKLHVVLMRPDLFATCKPRSDYAQRTAGEPCMQLGLHHHRVDGQLRRARHDVAA
jgi:hypothetical protein